jgi:hypothetical protein
VSRVRRILVVDDTGTCCGIISQADIARNASQEDIAEVIKKISEPMLSESNVV